MVRVAGHDFHSITPGEKCNRTDVPCQGIASLVELCALADGITEGVDGVAHVGKTYSTEAVEIKQAAATLKEHMAKVMGW